MEDKYREIQSHSTAKQFMQRNKNYALKVKYTYNNSRIQLYIFKNTN